MGAFHVSLGGVLWSCWWYWCCLLLVGWEWVGMKSGVGDVRHLSAHRGQPTHLSRCFHHHRGREVFCASFSTRQLHLGRILDVRCNTRLNSPRLIVRLGREYVATRAALVERSSGTGEPPREGVDSWGKGIDSWGKGVDSWGKGVDSWGKGIDSWGEGVDTCCASP